MKNLQAPFKFDPNLIHAFVISLSIVAGVNYFGVSWTGTFLLAWAILACWPKLKQGIPWVSGSLPAWALTWLIWLVMLVWVSHTPYSSWFYFWTLSGLPIALLAWQLLDQPDMVWALLRKGLWLGAAVFSLLGTWQVLGGEVVRAHGPMADPNAYAAALNLLWFPLAARFLSVDWQETSRLSSFARGVVLLSIGLAFFSANSRGAMLSWLLVVPSLFWFNRRCTQFKGKAFLLLGLWALAFGLMKLVTNYNFAQAAAFSSSSFAARWLIWRSTWSMIEAHPWLGSGLGTWSLFYPAFRDNREWNTSGYYAHNDYLQFAAEGGVTTLVLFLVGMILVIRLLWRLLKREEKQTAQVEAIGLLLGVAAISVHAFVNFIFYHAFINIVAGLFIGRALQVSAGEERFRIIPLQSVSSGTRKLIAGLLVAIAGGQLLLHGLAGMLNSNNLAINALHRVYPAMTEDELARLIHAIRPNELAPQNLLLHNMTEAINMAGLFGKDSQRAVLIETEKAYDIAREHASNRTQLGAEEAMMLIENRKLLPEGEALKRAERIAIDNLRIDPRHAESILALAEVQFAQGHKGAGQSILAQAIPLLFRIRDRRLLEVVYVKHWLAPATNPELDKMEQALRKIQPYTVEGKGSDNLVLYDQVDKKLREIIRGAGAKLH